MAPLAQPPQLYAGPTRKALRDTYGLPQVPLSMGQGTPSDFLVHTFGCLSMLALCQEAAELQVGSRPRQAGRGGGQGRRGRNEGTMPPHMAGRGGPAPCTSHGGQKVFLHGSRACSRQEVPGCQASCRLTAPQGPLPRSHSDTHNTRPALLAGSQRDRQPGAAL